MFSWTYWKSIFTPPASPCKKFQLSYSDKQRYELEERPDAQKQILVEIAKKLPIYTRAQSGAIRFCDRCQVLKPDRCHHCSVCETCVLKMDHHCPWVNNCVGFSNYKYFLLFLSYSMLYCIFITATVFQYFIKFWVGDLPNGPAKFHVLFLMFVALMFFVSLMFLFGYHCWLVAKNRSTLEAFSAPVFVNGPDRHGFNVGIRKNLQQVFGKDRRLWFIPVFTSQGNGHYFPLKNRGECQNPLLANGEMWEESDDASEEGSWVEDQDPPVTIEMEA
ncbi:palmitoyltransferase ZDHHC15B isoform X2 [Dunckerocampus dactyliophorus]|nr:palmitoyltransferase ZDHHC15B isoform X2 [Dunckerocampus dactyliophorus]XP_054647349.1 palmitoyltransferase ZDHHC15B isoform X2 [Dunckerocampus dactyliophorus]